jgi:DNA-binding response OmpR family regulator
MVDNRPAILIAEDQMFIAFEAERILLEAFDCAVEICRRDRLIDVLADKAFHVIILEFSGQRDEDLHYVTVAREAGAQVVLLTAGNDLADMVQAFPEVPLIRKPFNDAEVRASVERLLVRAQTS